ncbi:anti-anti-sigma factor [Endozoicomonas sp. (ex Bugula neritina AB1)]|nr:anti-anti-sigma factor [Endozoicomonas sp. (ex Bugula neritina AB1)]
MIPGKIQFAESEGTYVLKLIGEVRLTLCSGLEKFLAMMFDEPGFKSVIIDLSESDTIDSTSLGVLAKLSIEARRRFNQTPVLISPQPDISRILTSMGFERIFLIVQEERSGQGQGVSEIHCEAGSESSTHAQVLDAHRVLMNLNENNRKAFSDLVRQLERQGHPGDA